ncbi:Dabb family protein [Herbivorax sp. ANBcel31]|uniref:Dabb family protein n=1 Tax=Herbivorax sp. ANBcel31 TaxID=3069754 RepID=UPI0027B1F8B1|nr:Dabb family protein [Herbivorax sp. ANBcel31]MDQ2085072.1 Dabb family protein [Herbivorax sp. ANBcel31]
MIKHIVMWKLKESACGNTKEENAQIIKEKLESLEAKIPELLKIEVGIDFSKTENSADIVLYSEFNTKEDLEKYKVHPEHKAVVPFVVEAKSEGRVVDCEI